MAQGKADVDSGRWPEIHTYYKSRLGWLYLSRRQRHDISLTDLAKLPTVSYRMKRTQKANPKSPTPQPAIRQTQMGMEEHISSSVEYEYLQIKPTTRYRPVITRWNYPVEFRVPSSKYPSSEPPTSLRKTYKGNPTYSTLSAWSLDAAWRQSAGSGFWWE